MKRIVVKTALCIFVAAIIVTNSIGISAAGQPKISAKSKSVTVGKTFALKVSGAKSKIKWSKSNGRVKATKVYGKNNSKIVFKARKSGNVTVTAKVGTKRLKCKITVKSKPKANYSYTVYITETGTKYHSAGCRFLRSSKRAVDLSWAISHGYKPCGVCH